MVRTKGSGRSAGELLFVFAAVAFAILIRLPLMRNAELLLDSDMAFNALSVKHLLAGDGFFLYYPGQDYLGITEGVLGVLLTKVFGWSALAYLGSPLLFFLAYIVFLYLLTRQAFGVSTALKAACLAAALPVIMLRYAFLARGGYVYVLFAGALMLHALFRFQATRRPVWLYLVAFLAGFSYYTFKLSLVIIVPIVVYLLYQWRLAFPPVGRLHWTGPRLRALVREDIKPILIGVILLLAGLAPLIAARLLAPPEPRAHNIELAGLSQQQRNLDLLWKTALPEMLGYALPEPDRHSHQRDAVGVARSVFLGTVYALSLLYLLVHVAWRDGKAILMLERRPLSAQCLLLLCLAATLPTYCLSNYVIDPTSICYLMPLFVPLVPLLALAATRFSVLIKKISGLPGAGWVLVLVFCAIQVQASVHFYRENGFIAKYGWKPIAQVTAPREALRYLDQQGIKAAYGTYWIAYYLTFLTDERIIVAPYQGFNERRPPDYRRAVKGCSNPAYLFLAGDYVPRVQFEERMKAAGVPLTSQFFPGFSGGIFVYHATNGSCPDIGQDSDIPTGR